MSSATTKKSAPLPVWDAARLDRLAVLREAAYRIRGVYEEIEKAKQRARDETADAED